MSTTAPADLAQLDLADPRHWEDGPPFDLFDRLRAEEPVHFSPQAAHPDEGGFWSLTRAEDVHVATRDLKTFSSERRGIFLLDDIGVPLDVQRLQMISMDPPRHDRLKQIVGKAFTPKRIAEHEEHIRRIVTTVLDGVAPRGSCDLISDIARPVPARVIGSLFGTPPEDDERLVHWTNVATAFEDSEIRDNWEDSMEEIQAVLQYIGAAKQARIEQPTDDLLTALIDAEVDGDKLDDLELAVFFILLIAAGNDSTRATYSATIKALMDDPEQRQLLLDDPSLIPAAVEEGLRCFPAFSFMGRAATRDVELGGKQIKEGDRVLLWYLASNRDPERFEDPHRFDIRRTDVDRHQAFGAGGRHFCLGAGLARLELKVWIEETLQRFPDLRPDGPATRVNALFLNQYRSIPVRWTDV